MRARVSYRRRADGEKATDVHLRELAREDQADARAALDPHLAVLALRRAARLAAAAREQRSERVAVADVVAGPVRQARAEDLELEREEVREEAGARGRRERAERAEQVRALGRGLVEEPQARERGQPERPELGDWRSARRAASL